MKKLLALVLALVMTLSLCTISNAAFADAADIEHDEAVEAMSTLGVINGKGDNKFDPKGNVTRAEMAKMITIIMLGDIDAAAFKGTTTDLKDVNGHWAEGYIKYCYSQGVIAGKGNGLFDPNANVTAAEAAKMLLVAIGFDAAIQEYTGANWMLNVTRDAQVKGFYDELKNLTSGETLSRDKAAQMIWNAVQADGVKVTKGWNSVDNKITYNYNDADSLLVSTFGAVTAEKTLLEGITKVTAGGDKGTYTLTVEANPAKLNNTAINKVADDYSALLGQKVNIMFYDKNNNGKYDTNEKIFGVYPSYTNAATDLIAQSAFEKSSDKKVKANGTTYEFDTAAPTLYTVAINGVVATGGNTTTATIATANSTNLVRFVDTDESGKYDLVVVYTVANEKLTYADSSKVIGTNTYKTADCIVESGLKKDNYVAISWNFAESKTELKNIEKLSGKVTATKTNKAQIDGSWFYDGTGLTVDDTYDYYLLNGVLVNATKTTATAVENLVFVSGVDTTISGTQARVWHTDGTGATVTVDTTNTVTETGDDGDTPVIPTADRFYTISETSKGYKFTAANTTKSAMLKDYTFVAGSGSDVDTTLTIDDIGGVGINDDAVIFVYNQGYGNTPTAFTNFDVKVITGKQLKTLTAAAATACSGKILATSAGYLKKTTNGLDKIGYAAVQYISTSASTFAGWTVGATSDNYAIVVDAAINISGGTQYTVWTGSETVTVTDTDKKIAPAKFDLVLYDSITDGAIKGATRKANAHDVYTAAGDTDFTPIAITAFEKVSNGYKLYANGETDSTKAITTNSDTKWIYIDSNASEAADIGLTSAVELSTARTVYGVAVQNAIVYCSTEKTADVVVIDATNELDIAAATQFKFASATTLGQTDAAKKLEVKLGDDVVTTSTLLKAGDILTITPVGTAATVTTANTTNLNTTAATPIAFTLTGAAKDTPVTAVFLGTAAPDLTLN